MIPSSVIVHDLDVELIVLSPDEADAKSVVDSYAVLSAAIPFQCLYGVSLSAGLERPPDVRRCVQTEGPSCASGSSFPEGIPGISRS